MSPAIVRLIAACTNLTFQHGRDGVSAVASLLCLQISALQCDICCAADVAELTAEMEAAKAPPICCVLHVGGSLRDGTLPGQTAKSLRAVFAPKVQVSPPLVANMDRCAPFLATSTRALRPGAAESAHMHAPELRRRPLEQ